ncbi:hypothetical protein EJP77_07115 [Paenibacillus zeisoli]|uniref:UBX domain-containing protein n=1 Tax=Paenibacillus zeisoli TaxID=2496267 RepID=A0A3S1B700_9BACL|nr:hypothetical protein [Paenibacillus zeisoli]RUT33411.1 hypothetical protein EJP77_07115 [Paenibacillus zeisoli]
MSRVRGRTLSKPKRITAWTVILLLIFGSWGGNLWYYRSMQLEEPLFLKSYVSMSAGHGRSLELVYLENRYGSKKVTGVQIDELPELSFTLSNWNNGTYQTVMKAYAGFNAQGEEPPIKSPVTVKEVTVFYSEGPPRKVPIGEITILPDSDVELVDFYSSMASSDRTGYNYGTMMKPAVLERIDFTYSDRLKPYLHLYLSDKPIESLKYPISKQKGDGLSLSYKWEIPLDNPMAYVDYQPECRLEFRLKDGQRVTQSFRINVNFNLTDEQMKRLVRSGGEPQ